MFGLRNYSGSCWVNSVLQAIFACPLYASHTVDKENPIDVALDVIFTSKGQEGLQDFFNAVKTACLHAGTDIGDSHELLVHLCDKLPWLDQAFRFKLSEKIKCKSCEYSQASESSAIDVTFPPSKTKRTLLDAFKQYTDPHEIGDWTCEKCHTKGCSSQVIFGSFPRVLMIWSSNLNYARTMLLNGKEYSLFSVLCFNGGHWWSHVKRGETWYITNDTQIIELKQPVTDHAMRVLLYFLNEN
jgi:ubiquitin C-terminal hydrolase